MPKRTSTTSLKASADVRLIPHAPTDPRRQAASEPRRPVSTSASEMAKDIEDRLAKLSPAEEVGVNVQRTSRCLTEPDTRRERQKPGTEWVYGCFFGSSVLYPHHKFLFCSFVVVVYLICHGEQVR